VESVVAKITTLFFLAYDTLKDIIVKKRVVEKYIHYKKRR
jgi:hypothetical protein